ncbi:solute carrier organic anion transporter family member 4C1-like [Acanthaster planci]|uniref:Solute carrier organic anion transporter family member n=1 Tax=Acanthaster planci TaxID=133434 RepID=A0A8B8A4D8_ACAPL|nr:solute carrier organic anion transporter family member 4C1-like [Acanthaster planci]
MADFREDCGTAFTNAGFDGDRSCSTSLHIPTASDEKLSVPHSGFSDQWASPAGPESSVADGLSQPRSEHRSSQGQHAELESEDDSLPRPCGYCCWVPACLQRVASGRFFVLFLSMLCLTEAGLTVGYISSVVTSFELQFRFSSTLAGFVVSCYDIGTLVVILTSYFGGREAANRPKWIAWSAWSMTLGASIVTLPHFFISYKASGNDTVAEVCHPETSLQSQRNWYELEPACQGNSGNNIEGSALFFLIPGMLLIGAGSTATMTLGITYIDDFVRKKETPIMLAIVYSTTVIGPALGFLIGGFFLKYYVDFDTTSGLETPVSPSSPRWVGAWWLGFFFFAGAILVTAFPVYAFPAKLKRPAEKGQDGKPEQPVDEEDDTTVHMAFSDVSLGKIPEAIWGLLKNPVYMMVSFAAAAEFSIITGFVRFAPKFIQSQFQLKASTANLVTGTLIPVGALGVILGGFILNRVKTNLMGVVNVLTVVTILSGLMYGLIFIPGPCQNLLMAGVTTPYHYNDPGWQQPPDPYNINLTRPCNAACRCNPRIYSPVCSDKGVAYFNPCLAGCKVEAAMLSSDDVHRFEYFNCSCVKVYNETNHPASTNVQLFNIPASGEDDPPHGHFSADYEATTGLCEPDCQKLVSFLALLLLVVFVSSTEQMPALMTLLRCVKREERPFAIGLQFVILRLFGFIPSPVYYGAVIDSTCILWEKGCSGSDGACLQYDNGNFFYRYLGLSTLLKCISIIMAVLIWLMVRRIHYRGPVMTPLPSPVPTAASDDSGVGATENSVESQGHGHLSNDISTLSHFRYPNEAPEGDMN